MKTALTSGRTDQRERRVAGISGCLAIALIGDGNSPFLVYIAVTVWGLTFGGAATLLQTASADVAQAMLATAWNSAIAGGGIVGGVLLI